MRKRRLALALGLLLSAVPLAAYAPLDGTGPLLVWFPGETRRHGALMRGLDVAPDTTLLAVHRRDLVVLKSSDPWFAAKLIAAGGVPMAARADALVCAVPGV